MNGLASVVLGAAVDPAYAGDEVQALRERLARAGLLMLVGPARRRRPSAKVLARAEPNRAGRASSLTVFVVSELLDDAARLVVTHRLRAYDAVQLASARAVRALEPRSDRFARADRLLRAAAARERCRLVG